MAQMSLFLVVLSIILSQLENSVKEKKPFTYLPGQLVLVVMLIISVVVGGYYANNYFIEFSKTATQ